MLKEDLMRELWPGTFVEEVNLANKISVLRKVLEDDGARPRIIQTVPKLGYRFLPPVTRIWMAKRRPVPGPPIDQHAKEAALRFIALPFTVLNGQAGLAFLGHSLPEAVSGSLAGLRRLTVRSTLLAAKLLEANADPRSIAKEAEVDLLLTGSIVCENERLRLTAELVDAPTATVLGSYVCEAPRDHIFEIQDSLVRRIVELLSPQLTDQEHRTLSHDVPTSARAYEFYLRGTHVERNRTIENMLMARDLYRQSVEEDPDYAPAWARLGRCYQFLDKFDPPGKQDGTLTEWAFRRAFALNPDLPIAHHHYTPVEADAGHALRAMVRLLGQAKKHPNDPQLFSGLVQATRYCGLLQESLCAHEQARRRDSRAITSVAHTYFLLGDYEGTLRWYPPGSRFYLHVAAMAMTGNIREALNALSEPGAMKPTLESLRCTLRGEHARSIEIARAVFAGTPQMDPELQYYLSRHLAAGGALDEAIERLRYLAEHGFCCSTALRADPGLRGLVSMPGFPELMETVIRREAEAHEAFEMSDGNVMLWDKNTRGSKN
jgi:TolB-like protein/tetratricopeptide (TPR) repeat protein